MHIKKKGKDPSTSPGVRKFHENLNVRKQVQVESVIDESEKIFE